MRIAIGCDHRGLEVKQKIMQFLPTLNYSYNDFGSYNSESVDYPDIAEKVGNAVASGDFARGILLCSTGIGICIAANKIKGIRAALCHDAFAAQRARPKSTGTRRRCRIEGDAPSPAVARSQGPGIIVPPSATTRFEHQRADRSPAQ